MSSSGHATRLPPPPAQAAIAIGFVLGTWALVDGFHLWITGDHVRAWGQNGPWAMWGVGAILLGAAWMALGNLYLFQNRMANWKAFLVLVIVSSWSSGWAAPLVVAQFVLLLLPGVRRGLNGSPSPALERAESD